MSILPSTHSVMSSQSNPYAARGKRVSPRIEWPSGQSMPCHLCKRDISDVEEYIDHLYNSHSKTELLDDDHSYCCPLCLRNMRGWTDLGRHIRRHYGILPYSCKDYFEISDPANPSCTKEEKCTFSAPDHARLAEHRVSCHGYEPRAPVPRRVYANSAGSTPGQAQRSWRDQRNARKHEPYYNSAYQHAVSNGLSYPVDSSYASSSSVTFDNAVARRNIGHLSPYENVFAVGSSSLSASSVPSLASSQSPELASMPPPVYSGVAFPPPFPWHGTPSPSSLDGPSPSHTWDAPSPSSAWDIPSSTLFDETTIVDPDEDLSWEQALLSNDWLSAEAQQQLYADLTAFANSSIGMSFLS